MHEHRQAVRFEDVDAAGIVFFGCYAGYAHAAMESFFDRVEGGYAGLIVGRRVGFPAVAFDVRYEAPLRYGDRIRTELEVARLGARSAELAYRVVREGDEQLTATARHTIVCTDLAAMRSTAMPRDVRVLLEAHLAPR